MANVSRRNLVASVQIEYLGGDVVEGERQEVGARVHLKGGKRREGEVCGSAGEFGYYTAVECTVCCYERCVRVELEAWDTRDGESECKAGAARL